MNAPYRVPGERDPKEWSASDYIAESARLTRDARRWTTIAVVSWSIALALNVGGVVLRHYRPDLFTRPTTERAL